MSAPTIHSLPVLDKSYSPFLPEKKVKFTYYKINDTTKSNHPLWAAFVEKIHACANIILRAINYLYAKVWSSTSLPIQKTVTPAPTKIEETKPTQCDQGTSLPLQEPDEGFFEPNQENVETSETKIESTEIPPVQSSILTPEEMKLFQISQILSIQNAYKEEILKKENREATKEELLALCTPEVMEQINRALEEALKQATPEQISELKNIFQRAENLEQINTDLEEVLKQDRNYNLTALGSGFIVGVVTALANSIVGHYLSNLCFQGLLNVSILPKEVSLVTRHVFPALKYVAQGLALMTRFKNWSAFAIFSGVAVKALWSLKHVPKPLQNYITMFEIKALKGVAVAGSGFGAYMGYNGLKSYVIDQDYAIANEGGIIMRNGLGTMTDHIKNYCVNYALPQTTHKKSKESFNQGYTVGVQTTLAYLFAAALGLSTWTAAPIALMASAGFHLSTNLVKQEFINNNKG